MGYELMPSYNGTVHLRITRGANLALTEKIQSQLKIGIATFWTKMKKL